MSNSQGPKDFRALRASGEHAGVTKFIGLSIIAAREVVAKGLVKIGATPNRVTVVGFLFTCGAGYCLARGAGHQVPYCDIAKVGGPVSLWPFWAGVLLILSAACDILDGAVARIGNMRTEFGGVLDSTLDRFSDVAIYLGCATYFAWHGSVTYQILAVLAVANTFLISYVKARAEDIIPDCGVGWWQRGERYVSVLLGCFFGHMPFVLLQQATLPAFTVWRRLMYAWRAIEAHEAGQPAPPKCWPEKWWGKLRLWDYPRGSLRFDLVAAFNIFSIILLPWGWWPLLAVGEFADPLRNWLAG